MIVYIPTLMIILTFCIIITYKIKRNCNEQVELFNEEADIILTFQEVIGFYNLHKGAIVHRVVTSRATPGSVDILSGVDVKGNSFLMSISRIWIKDKNIGLPKDDYKKYIKWINKEIEIKKETSKQKDADKLREIIKEDFDAKLGL